MECALCKTPIHSSYVVVEEVLNFCCNGCRAVFTILSAKNELADFQEHPLFQQAVKAGLISNQQLLEEIRLKNAEEGKETARLHFEIGEMWCPACAEVIAYYLFKRGGVKRAVIDYATDLASVEFYPMEISAATIFERIQELGYTPQRLQETESGKISFPLMLRFFVAGFAALNIMMLAYPLYATHFNYDGEGYGLLFAYLSAALTVPVITYSAWPIYKRCFSSLKIGHIGMEALATLSILAAGIYSFYTLVHGKTDVYFDSLTVIVALMLLGKIMEAKAKIKAKEALIRLHRTLPKKARKKTATGPVTVLLKEVSVGDVLIAHAGERIVTDGIVTSGQAYVEESLMTGEALPVIKTVGDKLIGGTLLVQGSVEFCTEAPYKSSVLYAIVDLLEAEIPQKIRYERITDRISAFFVPLVVLLSLISGFFFGLTPALAVLMIACPCALGIAVPLAESYLIRRLGATGAIVRHPGVLRYLGQETLYVFDKTGTLTKGRLSVARGLSSLSAEDKAGLKALVSKSSHPIATAIDAALPVSPLEGEDVMEEMGKGLRSSTFALGQEQWLFSLGVKGIQSSQTIATTVHFAKDNKWLTEIQLEDALREEAADVLKAMQPVETALLSGDSDAAARRVAEQCGIKEWKGRFSPFDKQQWMLERRQSGQICGMLGDGVNDALAFSQAHVAISVVRAADISIQASDILLTEDHLNVLPELLRLGRKGRRIASENLFWAFFYNIIGLGLAFFGLLTPIFAAVAMTLSSFIVFFNSKRLLS